MTPEQTTALTVAEEAPLPSLLVGTATEKVSMATEIANALAPVINDKHLYAEISGKRHVLFEGWTTLGALLGVFPVTVWTHKTEDGWEARVEARTLAGATVGAAEAECSRSENQWKDREDFALRSMAQTRAGSKALRMPLGFVMQLAGFEATPLEEVTDEMRQRGQNGQPAATRPSSPPPFVEWKPEEPGDAPNCRDCNSVMRWRYGTKNGKHWQGWMCANAKSGDSRHAPVWVSEDELKPKA